MIQDKVIQEWAKEMKAEQERLAFDSMSYPQSDPFNHGVSVGIFQGLEKSRQILDAVIKSIHV